MRPLIDADVLCHELGWSGQFKDKDTKEEVLLDAEYVNELLDAKIEGICNAVSATEPPILFLSSSLPMTAMYHQRFKYLYEGTHDHVDNFRYDVAVTKPYKGTRKNPKPFHFYNIVSHMLTHYDARLSCCGNEADDEMGIFQTSSEEPTVICSRDKDLRMIPGHHYSWECGKQLEVGPVHTDELGWLEEVNKKVIGYGLKFFFYQMICGDSVDNIPGLPKSGTVTAFNAISPLGTEEECFKVVQGLYKEKMGEQAREYFKEQKQLLWIKRADRMEYVYE